jgi:hypothetical protein
MTMARVKLTIDAYDESDEEETVVDDPTPPSGFAIVQTCPQVELTAKTLQNRSILHRWTRPAKWLMAQVSARRPDADELREGLTVCVSYTKKDTQGACAPLL